MDSETLKKKRLESNLKINGICNFLGISRTTYYYIETGKKQITKEIDEKLKVLFKTKGVGKT